ncbi:glycosyltransferase [Acidithiobacillus ferriphilus]|uniref:glycosyltransferase n=1 Tax=Acidithiobacillus ferriphilus TaxID=1689834 RepID=UPI00232F9362|nr:glycosyltransferase [Acidithiobacillus ferriphilus]WCE93918.1 glycosyltransferase [Acidithiobacillus ferriphilus]
MDKILTIFIPSYNRSKKLDIALQSIFYAINSSSFGSLVEVLVVDDYSEEDIFGVIRRHKEKGNNVNFRWHKKKCGVAEVAMLRSLAFINTKYAWCIGNDDSIISDALDHLIPILINSTSSFFLLNFFGKEDDGSIYEYFSSSKKEIQFATGAQFFYNFGFATSTTTFPCLCFDVNYLKRINLEYILSISPIYSHTSAFYCAFYNLQCSFIPKPLVIFNHNEMEMEHEKLETRNKVFNKPSLYHACVGLGKHLEYMSLKTGCDLKQIANSAEDEIYKDSKNIKKTITIFFIFAFAIQQMRHEVKSYNNFNNNSFYLTAEDVEFLRYIFIDSGHGDLSNLFLLARGIYCSSFIEPEDKLNLLQSIANNSFNLEREAYNKFHAHRCKIDYVVYGQRNGIKYLTTSEPKKKRLNMGLVHCRMPTPQELNYFCGKYIAACELNDISRFVISDLNFISEVTEHDVVVFNTCYSNADFFKIFSIEVRAHDAPNDLTTWRRRDLRLEELIEIVNSSTTSGNSLLLFRTGWLNDYYENNGIDNPSIEFINYNPFG